jgi:hypothetical protein
MCNRYRAIGREELTRYAREELGIEWDDRVAPAATDSSSFPQSKSQVIFMCGPQSRTRDDLQGRSRRLPQVGVGGT